MSLTFELFAIIVALFGINLTLIAIFAALKIIADRLSEEEDD